MVFVGDANAKATGDVSFQKSTNNIEQPVTYFSKKFNKYQQNYSTIKEELL